MFNTHNDYRDAWDNAAKQDPSIPLHVDLEISSACQLKCVFCRFGDSDWTASMNDKDWDGKPKRRFMPKELAKKILDECNFIGVPSFKPNFRGEAVIHPDFTEIMEYGKGLGFHDILVNTNANCPDASIPGLMAATKVMVSLDSMDEEIYKKIRVGGKLEEAVKTINRLVLRGHKNIWVRRVICKNNEDDDFVSDVKGHWGDDVKVSEHFAIDRNKYQTQALHEDNPENWERKYCAYPSQRVVITASGKFLPCCQAWNNEFNMGTYGSGLDGGMSIREYWNSKSRTTLVSQLKKSLFKNELCKKCPSYVSYKRPESRFVSDVEGRAK